MNLAARAGHELRLAGVALQFLTRLPVPQRLWGRAGFQPAWLNACVRHFAPVGALVGLWGALVFGLVQALWGPWVAAAAAFAATAWLTGAFHEDGLADTLDALGGAVSRQRALEIMKDSRIGTYGALGLVLLCLLKVAALAQAALGVPGWAAPGAALASLPLLAAPVTWAALGLVLAHVLGRSAAVLVMAALPYAGDAEHAKAKPLATAVPPGSVGVTLAWVGLALALAWAAGAAPARLLAAGLAAAGVAACMRRWLRRRLGGYTGDGLGATEQLSEAAVLLAWCAHWPHSLA